MRSSSALTSRGDSTRPIIFFRDLPGGLRIEYVRLDEHAVVEPGDRRLEPREDQRARLLNEDAALAVDLVNDPEQRHHVAERG